MHKFDWEWQQRTSPLVAKAVLGFGQAALQLIDRLEAINDDEHRCSLQITGFAQGVVVFGAEPLLPWFSDAHYIGHAPEAPGLWLPLHLVPTAPLDLVNAAFQRQHPTPFLLWPQPQRVIDLRRQFPLLRSTLTFFRQQMEALA